MSSQVIMFDNGYRCCIASNYVADRNGMLIADLYSTVNNLPLNLNELSDEQVWALCKPIIQAYEMAIRQTEHRIAEKLVSSLGLGVDIE